MIDSIGYLKKHFPYFLDKSDESNFTRVLMVLNDEVIRVYNSIENVRQGYHLRNNVEFVLQSSEAIVGESIVGNTIIGMSNVHRNVKPVMIHRIQYTPYSCILEFIVAVQNIRYIRIYKGDVLVKEETFSLSSHTSNYYYNIRETSETIICNPNYRIIVETWDEYTFTKGYPENDIEQNNDYDHDTSLDTLGTLINCPRRKYQTVEEHEYPYTYPTYTDSETEDDYDYLTRLQEYTQRYWTMPLPTLELWKIYGVETKLRNRQKDLCKMGRDTMGTIDDILFIFNEFNTTTPFVGGRLNIRSHAYDSLGRLKEGNLAVYINPNPETNNEYYYQGLAPFNYKITNGQGFNVIVKYFSPDTPLPRFGDRLNHEGWLSDEQYINVRGVESADWYVSLTGDDKENTGHTRESPFRTLNHACEVCNDGDLICILNGVYYLNSPVIIRRSCAIIGDNNANVTLISDITGTIFYIPPIRYGIELYVQGFTVKDRDNLTYSYLEDTVYRNNGSTVLRVAGKNNLVIPEYTLRLGVNPTPAINVTSTITSYSTGLEDGLPVYFYDEHNDLIDSTVTSNGEASVEYTPYTSGSKRLTVYYPTYSISKSISVYVIGDSEQGDWYVDTVNGDNNNTGTSMQDAFKSLEYCLTQVTDGDTIIFTGEETFNSPLDITDTNLLIKGVNNPKILNTDGEFFNVIQLNSLTLHDIYLNDNHIIDSTWTAGIGDNSTILINTRIIH